MRHRSIERSARLRRLLGRNFTAVLSGLIALLLPKCPLCLVAMAWVVTILGLTITQYERAIFVFLIVTLSLVAIWNVRRKYGAARRQCLVSMTIGGMLLVYARQGMEFNALAGLVGITLYIVGSLAGVIRYPWPRWLSAGITNRGDACAELEFLETKCSSDFN